MMHSLCASGQMLAYGWGRNAPPLTLPPGVGFEVGAASGFTHAVLEVHYLRPPNATAGATDSSGVVMHLTAAPVPRAAGILMFAAGFTIPARDPDYVVSMECCYDGPQPLTAVAFRTHTHTLGRLVWLDRLALGSAVPTDAEPALRRSPLLPQAFALVADQPGARNPGGGEEGGGDPYVNGPLPGPLVIRPGQRLRASCRFNASESDHAVSAGATSADEMCNLYLLFHADAPTSMGCYNAAGGAPQVDFGPAAPAPAADARLAALPHAWAPPGPGALGQAGGADLSPDGTRLWVFHRGSRVWDGASFDTAHVMPAATSPVAADAVLALDVGTGAVLSSFGAAQFLMPHGLSTDAWGNVWLTDVGLHQVFKYSAGGARLLALGAPRQPGGGAERFCQPAAVAAAADGSAFVADGYCGARVAAFHPNGTYRGEWAFPADQKALSVPHALALDDCAGLLHVADRENGRVVTLAGVRGPPESWSVLGWWDTSAHGLPYALARAAGGDVFALLWARDGGGGVTLARLGDGRARRDEGATPAAAWPVPGAAAPHALALAAGPGGGPGQVLFIGEARPGGGSLLHRFALGDVDVCPWTGCGGAAPRLRGAGAGPGYAPPPAAQRRRVLATRAALVVTILLLIGAAAAPAVKGARMLPGGGRFGGGGAGGGHGRSKARKSVVTEHDGPHVPKAAKAAAAAAAAAIEKGPLIEEGQVEA